MYNDRVCDEEDFLARDESDSEEEETEENQHHPILSGLLQEASDEDFDPGESDDVHIILMFHTDFSQSRKETPLSMGYKEKTCQKLRRYLD